MNNFSTQPGPADSFCCIHWKQYYAEIHIEVYLKLHHENNLWNINRQGCISLKDECKLPHPCNCIPTAFGFIYWLLHNMKVTHLPLQARKKPYSNAWSKVLTGLSWNTAINKTQRFLHSWRMLFSYFCFLSPKKESLETKNQPKKSSCIILTILGNYS